MQSLHIVLIYVSERDPVIWMHLSEHLELINMLGVHFMMHIRLVISDNELSDGWRPVSAHDIHSHFYEKQVV